MKKYYFIKNKESYIESYNEDTPVEQKTLVIKLLDFMKPESNLLFIHAEPINYATEGRKTRLAVNNLFFITQYENKNHFFTYSFSGNNRNPNEILIDSLTEKSESDFFSEFSEHPELKDLHESFLNNLNKLKLNTKLEEQLHTKNISHAKIKI